MNLLEWRAQENCRGREILVGVVYKHTILYGTVRAFRNLIDCIKRRKLLCLIGNVSVGSDLAKCTNISTILSNTVVNAFVCWY